jgi:hypothetical protein
VRRRMVPATKSAFRERPSGSAIRRLVIDPGGDRTSLTFG